MSIPPRLPASLPAHSVFHLEPIGRIGHCDRQSPFACSRNDHESRARSIARNRSQKGLFPASCRRRASSAACRASACLSSSCRRRSSSALFASNFGADSRLRPASLYDVSYGSDQCGSLNHIGDERRMIAGGLGSLLGILQKPIFKTRGNLEFIHRPWSVAISAI